MSVILVVRECLAAKHVRVYSDTGAWKQTALRMALFSEPTPEYPMTLLQTHPDALITATRDTLATRSAGIPSGSSFDCLLALLNAVTNPSVRHKFPFTAE
jgi:hypothetical protein